jgi:hypothetical protein
MFSEALQSIIGFKSQEDFNAFRPDDHFYRELFLSDRASRNKDENVRAEMRAAIEKHQLHWIINDKQQKKMIKENTAIVTKSLLATARVNTHGDVGSLAVLHEDIIFRILKYVAIHELYGCIMLVSKAFYSLVTHMSFDDYVVDFRRAMKINMFNVTTFLKVLNRFKSNQQDVKQLVIGYIKYTDKTFDKIAVACPNLTHLTIDTIRGKYARKMDKLGFSALKNMKIHSYTQKGSALSVAKYIDIVRSIGESLTHLDIESIYDDVGNSKLILALAKCAPNLLSIKLSGVVSLDDDGVKALLAGCKKIETFELDTSRTYSKRVFLPESVRNTLTNAIKNVVILDFIEPTPY